MVRLLYITSRSDYGGGPEHVHQLASRLSSSFEISIACPKEEPYWNIFQRYAGCRVIEIPHRKFSLRHFFMLARTVKEGGQKGGIDIILSHGKGAGIYSRLLGVFTGRPVVHTFHGVHYRQMGALKKMAHILVERVLGKGTDLYINVSESERDACQGLNLFKKGGSVVIPNGVECPPFKKRATRGNPFTVINVSRLSHEKGVGVALEVIGALKANVDGFRGFRFIIVGDGPERAFLEKKAASLGIREFVEFLGFRSDVPRLLESADIILSASEGEGMPIAILEAMARGLPAVASDVDGNRDVVASGKTGFLFDTGSPEDGAKRILELMSDQRLYEAMSMSAYETASRQHSVEKMCERTKEVYLGLPGIVLKRAAALKATQKGLGKKRAAVNHK